jgi:rfaE bifunctional protein nucleotidyltransferase chain/domain
MITIKAAAQVARAQPKGSIIGLANGCFDILHPGHIDFLKAAKEQCYFLLVGINSDSSVERLKGKPRPFMSHGDRCEIIQSLKPVGFTFVFLGLDFAEAITEIKPNRWFKSTPWTYETLAKSEVQAAKAVGAEVWLLPTLRPDSSSDVIDRIRRSRLPGDFRYADRR